RSPGRSTLGAGRASRGDDRETGTISRGDLPTGRRDGVDRPGAADTAGALLGRTHALDQGGVSGPARGVAVSHAGRHPHDPWLQLPPVHEPTSPPRIPRTRAPGTADYPLVPGRRAPGRPRGGGDAARTLGADLGRPVGRR